MVTVSLRLQPLDGLRQGRRVEPMVLRDVLELAPQIVKPNFEPRWLRMSDGVWSMPFYKLLRWDTTNSQDTAWPNEMHTHKDNTIGATIY